MSRVISESEQKKKYVTVHGKSMAFTETGSGDPVLFLHGNPTSSYLWRNIMPHLSNRARCIAPDLIGMGDSEKLENPGPDRYTFKEHRHFLDAFIETMDLGNAITLVIHDWGSALGFDWANRHRDRVRGLAYMEAIVRPMEWDEWNKEAASVFRGFRSPAGEEMVLEKNIFVETVLPGSILRTLTKAEMDVYRRPFLKAGEDRRPTLTWPRQIPLGGEPADIVDIVQAYAGWMAENDLPKLFINAEPGAILTGTTRDFCSGWKNQTQVTVKGSHFVQEDSPHEIGEALADWYGTL